MAMMTCPDCKNNASTEAVTCPKCGRVFKPEDKKRPAQIGTAKGCLLIIGAFIAIAVIVGLFSGDSGKQAKAKPKQKQTQASPKSSGFKSGTEVLLCVPADFALKNVMTVPLLDSPGAYVGWYMRYEKMDLPGLAEMTRQGRYYGVNDKSKAKILESRNEMGSTYYWVLIKEPGDALDMMGWVHPIFVQPIKK